MRESLKKFVRKVIINSTYSCTRIIQKAIVEKWDFLICVNRMSTQLWLLLSEKSFFENFSFFHFVNVMSFAWEFSFKCFDETSFSINTNDNTKKAFEENSSTKNSFDDDKESFDFSLFKLYLIIITISIVWEFNRFLL
jgi:hypothetical protein